MSNGDAHDPKPTSGGSPFPGMDPFLVDSWGDVHTALTTYIRDALNDRLPDGYRATAEEITRVGVEGRDGRRYPDVRVERDDRFRGFDGGTSAAVLEATEPVVYETAFTITQRYVLVHGPDDDVVTAIEVVRPTIRRRHRDAYNAKIAQYREKGINIVEVDLLRSGTEVPIVGSDFYDRQPASEYWVGVWRASHPSRVEVYPFGLWDEVPVIGVPLRSDVPDTPLDLQTLIETVYRRGRYAGAIDYAADLSPPLGEEDQQRLATHLAV